MLRITGGSLKGRTLDCLKSNDIRPTTARVRESLFNILGHKIEGVRFLDLFGGSGCMGVEAISHGASQVIGLELSPIHLKLIKHNLEKLGLSSNQIDYIPCNAFEFSDYFCRKKLQPFNMVFCDPPFKLTEMEPLLADLKTKGVLTPDCLLIWEYPYRYTPTAVIGLNCIDERRYGDSGIRFYTLAQG